MMMMMMMMITLLFFLFLLLWTVARSLKLKRNPFSVKIPCQLLLRHCLVSYCHDFTPQQLAS